MTASKQSTSQTTSNYSWFLCKTYITWMCELEINMICQQKW